MVINSREFLLNEIPNYHPLSQQYINFWRDVKRKCIEGYWVGGVYMPPTLYFYVNMGTIKLNLNNRTNAKKFARPFLRDLEWDIFRYYTEARGFSGFKDDEIYTSNNDVINGTPREFLSPHVFQPNGDLKIYIPPYENLSKQHPRNMGTPLFENSAQNGMVMGARNTGKSYMVGVGFVLHGWIFDGLTEYSEESIRNPSPNEIIVGASLSNYSNDLLKKTKEAFDLLPGKSKFQGRTYPSPLSKQFTGSWTAGKDVKAEYKKKSPGGWETVGSRSTIKNRTFSDNAFAAQGTRPSLLVLEEIGMFPNAKETYTNTVDNLRDGLKQIGTMLMLGTGGDMESGTIDAAEMFYEPEKYNICKRPDIWENNGNIGYFIPAYLSLNQYKDSNGYTDIAAAKQDLLNTRESKSKGSPDALFKEIQYKPIVPSEMFLAKNAAIFPAIELRKRLSELQTKHIYEHLEKKVELYLDPESHFNGVSYELNNKLTAISSYPWNKDDREGCVVMYEEPYLDANGVVPQGAYIIGCDPYKDDSQTGESLAAIYVLKTNKYFNTVGHNEIVASFIGRPYLGKNFVNETLYKLSLFYGNATIYFENSVGNIKDYFEKIKRLDLLARQPVTVFNKKASYNTPLSFVYGYPMSNDKIKWEAIQYLRSWLLETREGTTTKNLDLIPDPGLIQELIAFNMKVNTDRVMALVGCIIGLEEIHNISTRKSTLDDESPFRKDFYKILVNNKQLFKNANFSKAEIAI